MAHLCARRGAGHGRAAGIGKQVQHAHLSPLLHAFGDEVGHPIPIRRLFGEQAGMFESGRADIKAKVFIIHHPAVGQFGEKLPRAAAFFAAMIMRLRLPPERRIARGPDGLRVGAAQIHVAPAFKLFTAAAIEDFIVLPLIC